jgi:hypothetical protein
MEIYNEEINDLLAPEHRKLQIHENIEVDTVFTLLLFLSLESSAIFKFDKKVFEDNIPSIWERFCTKIAASFDFLVEVNICRNNVNQKVVENKFKYI